MGEIYSGSILVSFILAFAVKNVKTYFSTGQSIRGKSVKLTASILLSTAIYVLLGLRLTILDPAMILEFRPAGYELLQMAGYVLITVGFILGIWALAAMKNSWRVGIKYDQKTPLVTTGIYAISRNPYFLSYGILILGFLLIFPSLLLAGLYMGLVITFHRMILEEEQYLESVHGDAYRQYRASVGRYFWIK